MNVENRILLIDPVQDDDLMRGMLSAVRIRILAELSQGSKNVNELVEILGIPQSTISSNVLMLESLGIITTEKLKGRKGTQKLCHFSFEDIVFRFGSKRLKNERDHTVEVEMPVGLYTNFEVVAPCGLCTPTGIVGYLDVPDSFLDPLRLHAGLLWFEHGFMEYKFPNNSLYDDRSLKKISISTELSSETPGTNAHWPSDITLWINDVEIGYWTSPGDFGDHRGRLTPLWWKLEGSQYGLLKNFTVSGQGSFVDGIRISDVKLSDLNIPDHHSIRVKIGVPPDAAHRGGINIFGKGFGNYEQDIILRMHF